MQLSDLQLVRPIPNGESWTRTIIGRASRVLLLYSAIALYGAISALVMTMVGVTVGILLLLVLPLLLLAGTTFYSQIRTFSYPLVAYMRSPQAMQRESPPVTPIDDEPANPAADVDPPAWRSLPAGALWAGRYQIDELLKHVADSVVYRATDIVSKQPVALILSPEPSSPPFSRFLIPDASYFQATEYQTVVEVHPMVIRVLDTDVIDGALYMATEPLDGASIEDIVSLTRDSQLGRNSAVHIAQVLTNALREVHHAGTWHSAVTPSNVYVESSSRLRLAWFTEIQDMVRSRAMAFETFSLQRTVPIPKQYATHEQRDIYAVGLILYELLTGRDPCTPVSMDLCISGEIEPPMTLRDDVEEPLNDLVMRCLARDPNERYHDLAELAQALKALGETGRETPATAV